MTEIRIFWQWLSIICAKQTFD